MLFYYYVCLAHCSCTEQGIKVALLATQEARAKEDRGRQVRTSPSTVVHQNRCVSFQCDAKLKTLDPALPDLTAPPAPSPSTASFHPGPAPPPPHRYLAIFLQHWRERRPVLVRGVRGRMPWTPEVVGGGAVGRQGRGKGQGARGPRRWGGGLHAPDPGGGGGGQGRGRGSRIFRVPGQGPHALGRWGRQGRGRGVARGGCMPWTPEVGQGWGPGVSRVCFRRFAFRV